MPLFFDLTRPSGDVARIELKPGLQRFRVVPGDRYRILDERGEIPAGLVVRRFENHLLVDDRNATVKVELTDYYGRCGISSPCTLEVGEAGGQPVLVTPATEPIQALTDGSFVLYQGAGAVGPLAAGVGAGAGEGLSTGWIVGGVVGGLALVGLAAGGGGGGGSDGTAVSASPPAPVPAPPPVAAPTPAPVPGPAPTAADTTPPTQPQLTSAKEVGTTRPVLSGTAEAGATVRVSFDTNRDGSSDAIYDTQAGADGQWRIDLTAAKPVSGALPNGALPDVARTAVTVVAIDASANVSEAQRFDLTVSTRAPSAPQITGLRDDSGARVGDIASGGSTDDLTPTLRGTLSQALAPGDRLVVLRDGAPVAAAVAVSALNWQVTDGGLLLGQAYAYEARVVDSLGVNSPSSNGWQVLTRADAVPTAQIVGISDNVARNTGPVADGGLTNDRSPTITGTLSQALGAGESLQVLRNGVATSLRPSVSGTSFSVTDSLGADGPYTYAVRIVTGAGAGAATGGRSIVVDTAYTKTAGIVAIVDDAAPTIGIISNNGQTNDTSPTLSGVIVGGLAPGETLEILRDNAVVGQIQGSGASTWTFSDSGLGADRHAYSVRVVDEAGNVGRESGDYTIRVSVTARDVPTAPAAVGDPATAAAVGGGIDLTLASLLDNGGAVAAATPILPMADSSLDRLLEGSAA